MKVLIEKYTNLVHYLKKAKKGLRAKNVEDVQFWLGDIFILLCENKEIIDPNIYEIIRNLKELLVQNTSKVMFIYNTFKNSKELESSMDEVTKVIESRINDLKLYVSLHSP